MKAFSITKVVSKDFIDDFISSGQNLIGRNLTYYEKMIQKGTDQCWEEVKEKKIKPEWFRFQITQLTNGAVAVMLYGEKK